MNGSSPSSNSDDVVLQADAVVKSFATDKDAPVAALNGVSLTVNKGRVTGLVGADGAGKTTFLRCAAGLLVPTGGKMTVLGLDSVRETVGIQSRIGYMPQKFGLYEDLTVQENLSLYADLQSIPKSERSDRFASLLSMTGLESFRQRQAGALSGGMKQKLGLACALVKNPELLLLDEPTVGVDPVSRRDLWEIVYQLVEDKDIGVLLSTAYLDEADACHTVALLHKGEKILEGPPSEFHKRVEGRVFVLEPDGENTPRDLQAKMMAEESVLDATIRSGRVRIVVTDETASQKNAEISERAQPAKPTFEDAFMAILVQAEEDAKGLANVEIDDESSPDRSADRDVLVQAEGLVKRFGDFEAVKGIGFEVRQGEVFGLLGPNGAGKSTTFRMLCGLLPLTEGRAQVAGRDLRTSRARARARLGYMAQTFSLYEQLSVMENFRFFGRAYGLNRSQLRKRIEWAVQEFMLGPYKETPAGALPGGYKQRLAMAAALLHEPDILFLDEPTSGVDPLARREFWLRIGRFSQAGVAVVVTTHFMEEAEYCDRLLIMSRGERLAEGSPDDIRGLARSDDRPEPSIEDAFVALAEGRVTADKPEHVEAPA